MTKTHTDDMLHVRYPVTPRSSNSKTINAERCKIRASDTEQARRNRELPKSEEMIEHERQLNKERQKRHINCEGGGGGFTVLCNLLQFCCAIYCSFVCF